MKNKAKIEEQIKNPPKLNIAAHDLDGIIKLFDRQSMQAPSVTVTLSARQLKVVKAIVETLAWLHTLLQLKGCSVFIIRKVLNIKTKNHKSNESENSDSSSSSTDSGTNDDDSDSDSDSDSDEGEAGDEINSEDSDTPTNANSSNGSGTAQRPNHHGQRGSDAFDGSREENHYCQDLSSGDNCPIDGCSGRVYPFLRAGQPRTIVRFNFTAPITAEKHVLHELRCNVCLTVFIPELPTPLIEDGVLEKGRFLFSAMAGITLMHFGFGMPFYRLDMLQSLLGPRLPESTQFDVTEQVANYLRPLFLHMQSLAANAPLIQGDDVSNKVLTLNAILKKKNSKWTYREGVHTSILIATTASGHLIPLLKTGIIQFGEWLDEVLSLRTVATTPIVVTDGSSANNATSADTLNGGCWEHLREYFLTAQNSFPGVVDEICLAIKEVFSLDRKTHTMSAMQRLEYLQAKALPFFEKISDDVDDMLEKQVALPKSELGEALTYFNNQKSNLERPFELPGVPLHNNLSEWCTYLVVRYLANSRHFATTAGAAIGDVIITIILCSFLNNINPFQYLHHCLKHHQALKSSPEAFMPWALQAVLSPLPEHKGFNFWHPPPPPD